MDESLWTSEVFALKNAPAKGSLGVRKNGVGVKKDTGNSSLQWTYNSVNVSLNVGLEKTISKSSLSVSSF